MPRPKITEGCRRVLLASGAAVLRADNGVGPASWPGGLPYPGLRVASALREMPGLHHSRLAAIRVTSTVPRDVRFCLSRHTGATPSVYDQRPTYVKQAE
jgi:hypothetical protein